jgi:hypothetical protein
MHGSVAGIAAQWSTGARTYVPFHVSSLAKANANLRHFDVAWRCIGEAMRAAETPRKSGTRPRSIASPARSQSSRRNRMQRKRISSARSRSRVRSRQNPGNYIGGLRIAERMIGHLFRIHREGRRHHIKQPQEPQVLRCPRLEAWSIPRREPHLPFEVSQPPFCRALRSVYERVDPSHAVGLFGDFFLGKANFGSAFMRELKQALLILQKLVLGNRLVGPVKSIPSVLHPQSARDESAIAGAR